MTRWRGRSSRNRGFTLIELVVVMTIIAILATAVTLEIVNRVEDGRRTRALSDIKTYSTALDLYAADNGQPPTTQQGLDALRNKPASSPQPRNWNGPYVREIKLDPWGNDYVYRCPGQLNPDGYDLISYASDGRPGGTGKDEDVTTAG